MSAFDEYRRSAGDARAPLAAGFDWINAHPDPKVRGGRATVFFYALYGLEKFPGCKDIDAICHNQDISRSSFYAGLAHLRSIGVRF